MTTTADPAKLKGALERLDRDLPKLVGNPGPWFRLHLPALRTVMAAAESPEGGVRELATFLRLTKAETEHLPRFLADPEGYQWDEPPAPWTHPNPGLTPAAKVQPDPTLAPLVLDWWQAVPPNKREAFARGHQETLRAELDALGLLDFRRRYGLNPAAAMRVKAWLGIQPGTTFSKMPVVAKSATPVPAAPTEAPEPPEAPEPAPEPPKPAPAPVAASETHWDREILLVHRMTVQLDAYLEALYATRAAYLAIPAHVRAWVEGRP